MSLKLFVKGSQVEAGDVHLRWICCNVQAPENIGYSVKMLRREFYFFVCNAHVHVAPLPQRVSVCLQT